MKAGFDADQTVDLQAAFDWLSRTRSTLILDPGASYQYSETLEIRGGTLVGNGATFIARNASKSCIYVRGENVSISDLAIISNATSRSQKYDAVGMMVMSAKYFRIENISIYGVACGGFGVDGSHHGDIAGIKVRSSLADGFHITNGSSNIRVSNYKCFDTGDDGFAIVTYDKNVPDAPITRNITAQEIIVKSSKARGIAIVGARDIDIRGVLVQDSACAGIYLNSESSYGTYGNEQVRIRDAELVNCVTRVGINQGCIHIQGRTRLRKISSFSSIKRYATRNALISNALIKGIGRGARAAIIVGENSEEVSISAQIQGVNSPRKYFICDIKDAERSGVHVLVIPHVTADNHLNSGLLVAGVFPNPEAPTG